MNDPKLRLIIIRDILFVGGRVAEKQPTSSDKYLSEDSSVRPQVGDLAPDFTLPSHIEEKSVTLNHLRGKNVVLVFYPAAFTPV